MSRTPVGAPEIYTDLQGLNALKSEKNSDLALKKVAQEFESIFINIMLKSMRDANAVFEKDNMLNSSEGNTYRDMYDQQMALSLAKGKGLGIADLLYRQLQGNYAEHFKQDESATTAKAPLAFEPGARRVSSKPAGSLERSHKATEEVDVSQKDEPQFQSKEEFVSHLLPAAEKAARVLGLNPLMMIAQAALETGWGKHLVKAGREVSNNLFNIKADAGWQGEALAKTTLEYKDGLAVKESAQFRSYSSFDESMQDFVEFVQTNPRYQNALAVASQPKAFIEELHKAGYATDPDYAAKVIGVFDQLQQPVPGSGRN